ncbi:MAG: glycosyltransferase family 2 protein [Anaerolineales bacterium]|nr:glycosyltransferase family 2 protein [Anaerolineales bacterium]
MASRVTIIVPCYNEKRTITDLFDAIRLQNYHQSNLEIVVADGMSDDGTRDAIRDYASQHPEMTIRLIDNPQRIIPAALNKAIEAAKGNVIIRLDAHSAPRPDYVERCLTVLEETGAANVGGMWEIQPGAETWTARAIALAASHPLGAGDARYRISGEPGPVDTVPFGAFRREWLERVGPFNEELLTNEDYEYNVRICKAGGVVWIDPSIRSIYFARPDLRSLARQYWRYGFWKVRMLRLYPGTLRWRQALPPIFVLSTVILTALAFPFPLARLLLAVQLGAYLLVTTFVGLLESIRRKDMRLSIGFPLAVWTMHSSWGAGFLWSVIKDAMGGRHGSN